MEDIKIVLNSCDAYQDVWELFFVSFEEFWPNCPYKIIINTESKPFNFHKRNVSINTATSMGKKDRWGLRLKETLRICDSKYVIILYDDFVLEGLVNIKAIEQCIYWLKSNQDTTVFYLTHNSANFNIDDRRYKGFEAIPQNGNFKLNSAPALWRRDKLLNYIDDDDTPWAWEFFGSYRTYKNDEKFYCVKKEYEKIYPYNDSMGGAIYRGKWVGEIVIPLIKKYNLKVDLKQRGLIYSHQQKIKRSLKWKIDFFLLGYKMIGFSVLIFLYRIFKAKALKIFHA